MTIKEFFFLVLCVAVSLLAGYGIVKLTSKPIFSRNMSIEDVLVGTELGDFNKAIKTYSEEKELSEAEAFNHLRAKAKEYLQAKEAGRSISEDDQAIQRLKAKAKEYFQIEEDDQSRIMSKDEETEFLKSKAKLLFELDEERF